MKKTKMTGFTLVELVVVIGIYAILVGLTLKGTVNPQVTATLDATLYTLVSDIKQQQIKSMIGFTADESTSQQFGIYFESDSYTVFTGSSYSSSDPDNFKVNLAEGLTFTDITFPSSIVVFNKRSGDLSGYAPGANSVTLVHEDTSSTKISLNRYGAITIN